MAIMEKMTSTQEQPTTLRLCHRSEAPKTSLTFETALPVYNKLKPFLALRKNLLFPGQFRSAGKHRCLATSARMFTEVVWAPNPAQKYRRLRYDEFCAYYNIYPFNGREF